MYISFNSLQAIPIGTPSLTTGIGQMVRGGREWAFNMQMASGSSTSQVTHWAREEVSHHQQRAGTPKGDHP